MNEKYIRVAQDFSKFPMGRYHSDGKNNATRLLMDFIVPSILYGQTVVVDLDGVRGYGSAFLEEAFGGLIRLFQCAEVKHQIKLISKEDPYLINEINSYIEDAIKEL